MATAQPTRGSEQVSQAPKGSPAIAVSTTASEGNESDQPKMVDASTQTQETKAREDEIETSFRVDKPPHSHLPPSVSKYQYYYGDKTPSNRGEREKRQDKRKEVRPPGRQERVDSAEIRRKAIEAYITAVSDEEGEDQPEWLPNNVGENITNCGPRAPTRDAARGYESSETGDSDEDESSDSDDDDPLYLKRAPDTEKHPSNTPRVGGHSSIGRALPKSEAEVAENKAVLARYGVLPFEYDDLLSRTARSDERFSAEVNSVSTCMEKNAIPSVTKRWYTWGWQFISRFLSLICALDLWGLIGSRQPETVTIRVGNEPPAMRGKEETTDGHQAVDSTFGREDRHKVLVFRHENDKRKDVIKEYIQCLRTAAVKVETSVGGELIDAKTFKCACWLPRRDKKRTRVSCNHLVHSEYPPCAWGNGRSRYDQSIAPAFPSTSYVRAVVRAGVNAREKALGVHSIGSRIKDLRNYGTTTEIGDTYTTAGAFLCGFLVFYLPWSIIGCICITIVYLWNDDAFDDIEETEDPTEPSGVSHDDDSSQADRHRIDALATLHGAQYCNNMISKGTEPKEKYTPRFPATRRKKNLPTTVHVGSRREAFPVALERGFLKLNIKGIEVFGLIDTGAAPSCISLGIFRKILRSCRTYVPIDSTNYSTFNFVGEQSEVVGQVMLDVTAKSIHNQKVLFHNVPFLITPNTDETLILGQNLLKPLGAVIGYANQDRMYVEFNEPQCRILSEPFGTDPQEESEDDDVRCLN